MAPMCGALIGRSVKENGWPIFKRPAVRRSKCQAYCDQLIGNAEPLTNVFGLFKFVNHRDRVILN